MAIPVTTRAGKGSPLTNSEMDANLDSLARSATTSLEGNVRISTSAEAIAGTVTSDPVAAVDPVALQAALTDFIGNNIVFTDHGSGEGTLSFLNGSVIVKYGTTGAVTGGSGSDTGVPLTVTYPTAFPTDTLVVVVTMNGVLDDDTNAGFTTVDNFLPASFRLNLGENPQSGNPTFNYIAIGN